MPNKVESKGLVSVLTVGVQRLAEIEAVARKEREDLERALKLARGTSDVHEQAARAVATKAQTIEKQIELALRSEHAPMSIAALAKMIGFAVGKVSSAMRELKQANRVYNMGTEDHPCWIWIVGDGTTTRELNDHVARLITYQPMTFAQLMSSTGARRGRVSGALVEVQKTRKDWQNLGNEKTFRWFLPPVKSKR